MKQMLLLCSIDGRYNRSASEASAPNIFTVSYDFLGTCSKARMNGIHDKFPIRG